jgi:hypothetical protein
MERTEAAAKNRREIPFLYGLPGAKRVAQGLALLKRGEGKGGGEEEEQTFLEKSVTLKEEKAAVAAVAPPSPPWHHLKADGGDRGCGAVASTPEREGINHANAFFAATSFPFFRSLSGLFVDVGRTQPAGRRERPLQLHTPSLSRRRNVNLAAARCGRMRTHTQRTKERADRQGQTWIFAAAAAYLTLSLEGVAASTTSAAAATKFSV